MRHKQRIDCFLLDEFLEQMLRHFEIGELRQDFQFEFVRRAFAPLLAGELEPISASNFPHRIVVARAAPRPFQIDGANNFPIGISVLDGL